jgi:hypothetical protein
MNPDYATVKHTPLKKKTVPETVSTIANICTTGAQSPEVQNAPVALQALGILQKANATAQTGLSNRQSLAQALIAAIRALTLDTVALKVALETYEAAVNAIALGNAAVITRAGLLVRGEKTPPAPLGVVTGLHTKPGKLVGQGILGWPAAPGATGYAIEVNYAPQSATSTWTALNSGTSRRRVLTAPTPTPASQFQARVAALGSDGTQSAWSNVVTVTTR